MSENNCPFEERHRDRLPPILNHASIFQIWLTMVNLTFEYSTIIYKNIIRECIFLHFYALLMNFALFFYAHFPLNWCGCPN